MDAFDGLRRSLWTRGGLLDATHELASFRQLHAAYRTSQHGELARSAHGYVDIQGTLVL